MGCADKSLATRITRAFKSTSIPRSNLTTLLPPGPTPKNSSVHVHTSLALKPKPQLSHPDSPPTETARNNHVLSGHPSLLSAKASFLVPLRLQHHNDQTRPRLCCTAPPKLRVGPAGGVEDRWVGEDFGVQVHEGVGHCDWYLGFVNIRQDRVSGEGDVRRRG